MPRKYSAEFRRKVVDLVDSGRSVASIALDLEVSNQSIYAWHKQHLIDTGQMPGISSRENAELKAAHKRIAELETELAAERRANELMKELVSPKAGSRSSRR